MYRLYETTAPYVVDHSYDILINDDEGDQDVGYYSVSDNAVYFLGDCAEDYEKENNLPDDFIKLPSYLFDVKPLAETLFYQGLTSQEMSEVQAISGRGFFSELKQIGMYTDYVDAKEMACLIVLRRFEREHGIKLIAD